MLIRQNTYRRVKVFSNQTFLKHIECVAFHVRDIFDDIDNVLWSHNDPSMSVIVPPCSIKIEICKGKSITPFG